MLALNADIEAARVGKYGKGFAVVANSVRTLATKSQESVKNATQIVDQVAVDIKRGVELVEITSEQLEEIKKGSLESKNIAEAAAQLNQEQARSIEQISKGIMSIEEVVQNNSASAEENASSSEELAKQAEHLEQLISYFSVDNRKYDEKINYNEITAKSGLKAIE